MSLPEFLLARFAEDEAAVGEWPTEGSALVPDSGAWLALGEMRARVLAECAAKRRIVQDARQMIALSDDTPDDGSPHSERIHGGAQMYDRILCFMVSPYADHPDYDEDWCP